MVISLISILVNLKCQYRRINLIKAKFYSKLLKVGLKENKRLSTTFFKAKQKTKKKQTERVSHSLNRKENSSLFIDQVDLNLKNKKPIPFAKVQKKPIPGLRFRKLSRKSFIHDLINKSKDINTNIGKTFITANEACLTKTSNLAYIPYKKKSVYVTNKEKRDLINELDQFDRICRRTGQGRLIRKT